MLGVMVRVRVKGFQGRGRGSTFFVILHKIVFFGFFFRLFSSKS